MVHIARGRLANPTRDLPPHLSTTIRSTRDSSQRRLSSRLRCEMRSRSMTRRTSRADVWATISGRASPTCQKQDRYNVAFIASWPLSSSLLGNAWHKCGEAHIANGMCVANGAGSVAGLGRGARRALNALSSRVQKERQDWGASPSFKLCPHCFLCCGRAGGNGRSPLTRSSWLA